MIPREQKRARWFLLVPVALVIALLPVQAQIRKSPAYHNEYSLGQVKGLREGGTIAIIAMIGGFRPLVANLLWLKVDGYWHKGPTGYWRMVPILNTICEMDPHFIDAWSTFGWHCAWNIWNDAAPQDRDKWTQTGIDVYKRGQYFNPDRYELYKDLAWLYHDKLRDYTRAIPEWKKTLAHKDAPIYCRHMLAHAYEQTGQWKLAVETWKECVKQDRRDHIAKQAIEWWQEQSKSPETLQAEINRLRERDERIRRSRGLPTMEQYHGMR